MSLKTRIEAYTGSLSTVATDSIRKSIAKVVDLIPDAVLLPFATLLSAADAGANVTDMKVLGATVGGYDAKEVPSSDFQKYQDTNSIYYATARCPVYYQTGNRVRTFPVNGDALVINYAMITENDVSLLCIPSQFEEAVILDVAIGKLSEKLSTVVTSGISAVTLPADLTYEPVTFPADLVAGDLLWADAVPGSLTANTIATLTTGPSLTDVTATIDAAPSVLSNFTETLPSSFTPTAVAPGTFTLSILPQASGEPLEGHQELIYPAAIGSLTLAWSDCANLTSSWNSELAQDIADAQTNIATIQDAIMVDFSSGNEDIELGMARASHVKTMVEDYIQRADLFLKKFQSITDVDKLNRSQAFQKTVEAAHNELARFAQDLQRFINHAQLLIAEHKENVELFQVKSTFEVGVFKSNLEKYQVSTQLDLAKFKANVELWQAEQQVTLGKYQADIAKFQNDLNAKMQVWNADVQKKFKEAEIASQVAANIAQMTSDINLQNKTQGFQAKVTKYQAQLQAVAAHLQKRQADIQLALSKQQANIAQVLEQYKAITNTIQVLQGRFFAIFAPFQKQEQK